MHTVLLATQSAHGLPTEMASPDQKGRRDLSGLDGEQSMSLAQGRASPADAGEAGLGSWVNLWALLSSRRPTTACYLPCNRHPPKRVGWTHVTKPSLMGRAVLTRTSLGDPSATFGPVVKLGGTWFFLRVVLEAPRLPGRYLDFGNPPNGSRCRGTGLGIPGNLWSYRLGRQRRHSKHQAFAILLRGPDGLCDENLLSREGMSLSGLARATRLRRSARSSNRVGLGSFFE